MASFNSLRYGNVSSSAFPTFLLLILVVHLPFCPNQIGRRRCPFPFCFDCRQTGGNAGNARRALAKELYFFFVVGAKRERWEVRELG